MGGSLLSVTPMGLGGHGMLRLNTSPMRHTVEIRGASGTIRLPQAFVPTPNQPTQIELHTNDGVETIDIEPADHYQIMVEDFAE